MVSCGRLIQPGEVRGSVLWWSARRACINGIRNLKSDGSEILCNDLGWQGRGRWAEVVQRSAFSAFGGTSFSRQQRQRLQVLLLDQFSSSEHPKFYSTTSHLDVLLCFALIQAMSDLECYKDVLCAG